ncbi:MAG: protein glxC [Rhodospirillales bacterium]
MRSNIIEIDLDQVPLRDTNRQLQTAESGSFRLHHPRGAHALGAGLTQPIQVTVAGHVGFYCAGMNQAASIAIEGHAGVGLAENMMSGEVRVTGNASQGAGATGHGGLLVIEGDCASRCGISMKGIDIVVGGSVGHMSAFMGQAGCLAVLGDAGPDLGDSLYEARLYVRGRVDSLGADCKEKDMTAHHLEKLARLLDRAKIRANAKDFRRYGSARRLYHFKIDNLDSY